MIYRIFIKTVILKNFNDFEIINKRFIIIYAAVVKSLYSLYVY